MKRERSENRKTESVSKRVIALRMCIFWNEMHLLPKNSFVFIFYRKRHKFEGVSFSHVLKCAYIITFKKGLSIKYHLKYLQILLINIFLVYTLYDFIFEKKGGGYGEGYEHNNFEYSSALIILQNRKLLI